MTKRFTVDSDGKYWDRLSNKYVTIDHLFYLVEKLEKESEQLKYSLSAHMVDLNNYKGRCSALEQENESLKEENKFLQNKVKTYKSGNALLKKTLDKEWK